MISNVQHAVDAGVHQLFLLVAQILADVLRDEHYVALHVDHEEEAVQGLRGEVEVGGRRRQREKEKKGGSKERERERQKRWRVAIRAAWRKWKC